MLEVTNNKITAFYVHALSFDNPIGMLRDRNLNGSFEDDEIYYFTKDHLGSVREIVGLDGKIKQRQRYSAYGRTTREKSDSELSRLIDQPYGFTSREHDSETGMYYYRARHYDPSVGRFVSEDPIGFAGGDSNLYRYVRNNPIYYTDPSGLLRNPNDIFDEALRHPNSDSSGRGQGNAFQHCFASCMMSAENTNLVSLIAGHAWETVNNFQGQSTEDYAMDTKNNGTGRNFGNQCPVKNRTTFNKEKSKDISNYCSQSCSNANLMRLDF